MKLSFISGVLSFSLLSFGLYASPTLASNVVTSASPVTRASTLKTPINLNTADSQTLSKSIKGIGLKRAEAIIKYREAHDGFKSINELSEVPRIGKNFVSKHLKEIEETFIVK